MVIDTPHLLELSRKCAPQVAPTTMVTLIRTESKGNPLALGLNGARLKFQPRSESQAIAWVRYLDKHNYNYDVGLGQVNSNNIRKFKLKPEQLLNPCLNIKVSAYILTQNYLQAKKSVKDPQVALGRALSTYNTGNQYNGYNNGYIQRVLQNIVD